MPGPALGPSPPALTVPSLPRELVSSSSASSTPSRSLPRPRAGCPPQLLARRHIQAARPKRPDFVLGFSTRVCEVRDLDNGSSNGGVANWIVGVQACDGPNNPKDCIPIPYRSSGKRMSLNPPFFGANLNSAVFR
ncbi:hypothetical protein FJTKL_01079 [Diaporthe vaccinii]|uniref:Uncharacterized protein n=1 Tax=Diaporthe vaccinii TaxID=105482 RepID=A0ABR4F4Y3_9PEZI